MDDDRRLGRLMLVILVVLLLAIPVGFFLRPAGTAAVAADEPEPDPAQQRLVAMQQLVEDMSRRLDALEEVLVGLEREIHE